MFPGGPYSEAGGTPTTVPLTYTVALPMYMLPISSKVTSRMLVLPLTVRLPEVMLNFPQYVPGEPHGEVVEATVEVIVVVPLVEGPVVLITVDVRAPGNE